MRAIDNLWRNIFHSVIELCHISISASQRKPTLLHLQLTSLLFSISSTTSVIAYNLNEEFIEELCVLSKHKLSEYKSHHPKVVGLIVMSSPYECCDISMQDEYTKLPTYFGHVICHQWNQLELRCFTKYVSGTWDI